MLPTDSARETRNSLSNVSFSKDDIVKIMNNLDLSKTHGEGCDQYLHVETLWRISFKTYTIYLQILF